MVNRLVAWILRSPFSRLLDRSVMLISVKGRRTGREYTLPVNYADEGHALWVLPGFPERKTWWRNLDAESSVRLRLRGRDLHAKAHAFRGDRDPATVSEGLRAYLRRFPGSARAAGIENDEGAEITEELLARGTERAVVVRIVPTYG